MVQLGRESEVSTVENERMDRNRSDWLFVRGFNMSNALCVFRSNSPIFAEAEAS